MIFLRPWFLILLCVPLLSMRVFQKKKADSIWEKLIAPELLDYLLVRSKTKSSKNFQKFKIFIWTILVLGVSGPAWYKTPVPTQEVDPATIIVLDLGSTMIGDNLEKAKRKMNDILDELKDEQVALVLYDKVGYTAAPLTFDGNIIREMLPYLERGILPNPATLEMISGFKKASEILKNSGLDKGRILFITAGEDVSDSVQQWAKQNQNPVGVLLIGSLEAHPVALPTGGFLKDEHGQLVMVKPKVDKLAQLGPVQAMTTDNSDVQLLIQQTPFVATGHREGFQDMEIWQDMGGWFVLFSVPFFLLLFRKRMLILFLFFALPTQAGLWLRPDQESYLRQEQGVQFYRAQNYEKAEELFSSGFNADDLYNWGNALAFQQKIQEAIDAYQQALDEQPDHADALFNKEYLEKQLKKQKEEQNQPQKEEKQDEEPPKREEQSPEEQQEQDKSLSEQKDQSSEQKQDEEPLKQEDQSFEQKQEQDLSDKKNEFQNQQEKKGLEEQPVTEEENIISENEQESPFDQGSQQLLNRLPDTPPSLLKYRLRRQYENYLGK